MAERSITNRSQEDGYCEANEFGEIGEGGGGICLAGVKSMFR